mmetsp:Transcript_84471/g.152365  ORF Transcript_84471/g.152365 Transcript_84471/m.152365 type:complete len:273 (-) Transcript_84471:42-860(-)
MPRCSSQVYFPSPIEASSSSSSASQAQSLGQRLFADCQRRGASAERPRATVPEASRRSSIEGGARRSKAHLRARIAESGTHTPEASEPSTSFLAAGLSPGRSGADSPSMPTERDRQAWAASDEVSQEAACRLRQIAALRQAEARIAARKRQDAHLAVGSRSLPDQELPASEEETPVTHGQLPKSPLAGSGQAAEDIQKLFKSGLQIQWDGNKAELKAMLLEATRRLVEARELNQRMKDAALAGTGSSTSSPAQRPAEEAETLAADAKNGRPV